MTKRITDKAIREYLGHNGSECRVVIRRNGDVHRIGSPDASNRNTDFWAYMGHRDDVAHQMTLEEKAKHDPR